MTDKRLDDPVLVAVRAARPAPPAGGDASSSPGAEGLLARAMASDPGESRHGRPAGWAVPVLAGLTTIVVVAVALGALGRSHHPRGVPARPGSVQSLSASQYAFAVGGDASAHTSPTQASSGLVLIGADQVLRERCMRQRGFRYIPDPIPTTTALPSVTGYPSTFYPQPSRSAYPEAALLALREHEGFATAGAGSGIDPDPDDRYLKTLPPARQTLWRNAWMGPNGCYGAAEVQLFGSRQAANLEQQVPTAIYNYLDSNVYTPNGALSTSNPRTADAAAAWSRCMRIATGETWTDEDALISGLTNVTGSSARHLAVADTRCSYSTGQAQAFAAAFRHGANHLPARTEAELQFLLAHRRAWIAKARRVIASSKP